MPNPCQKTVFYNLQLLLGMKSFPNWQVLLSKVSLSARLRLGINPSADHHAIIRSKSVICYFIEDHIWYPITMLVARILCCDKAYRPWMSMFVDKPGLPYTAFSRPWHIPLSVYCHTYLWNTNDNTCSGVIVFFLFFHLALTKVLWIMQSHQSVCYLLMITIYNNSAIHYTWLHLLIVDGGVIVFFFFFPFIRLMFDR